MTAPSSMFARLPASPFSLAMILNLTAVYSLRAMATLARLAPGESLNAAALSDRTGVPQQYLSKVMRKLVVAKLVRSQRGHGGGFQLQQPPARIRIADVLRAVDLQVDDGCAFGYPACDPINPCELHPLWTRLKENLDTWAEGNTLEQLGPARQKKPRRS